MIPDRRTPASTAAADPAQPPDRVDGPQVVLVAVLGRLALVQRDPQARAVEGLLDVVGRQGVAGEEGLDPPVADQLGDVPGRAGVDDRRAADEEHLLAGLARVARIDSATPARLTALGFSLETFEPMKPKRVSPRAAVRPAATRHAGMPDDDRQARSSRRSSPRTAPTGPPGRRRSRSPSPGRPRRPSARRGGPASADWSCCRTPRGRPRRCRPRTTRASSGLTGVAPCSTRSPRIASSSAARSAPDGDPGVAGVDPPGADPALPDLEGPPHLEDPVEDLRQERASR